jgi:hypothetical protein
MRTFDAGCQWRRRTTNPRCKIQIKLERGKSREGTHRNCTWLAWLSPASLEVLAAGVAGRQVERPHPLLVILLPHPLLPTRKSTAPFHTLLLLHHLPISTSVGPLNHLRRFVFPGQPRRLSRPDRVLEEKRTWSTGTGSCNTSPAPSRLLQVQSSPPAHCRATPPPQGPIEDNRLCTRRRCPPWPPLAAPPPPALGRSGERSATTARGLGGGARGRGTMTAAARGGEEEVRGGENEAGSGRGLGLARSRFSLPCAI